LNERHGIDEKLAVSISGSGAKQREKRTESFEEDAVARSESRERSERRREEGKGEVEREVPKERLRKEGKNSRDDWGNGGGLAVVEDSGEVSGGVRDKLDDSNDFSLVVCIESERKRNGKYY